MKEDVDRMAVKLNMTAEEVLAKLKENYDGYHFTYPSPDIYNPFSLLNAFADGKFNSYWFGSGTPTYLIKMLDKFGVEPSEIGNKLAAVEEFDAPTETMSSITPVSYTHLISLVEDLKKYLGHNEYEILPSNVGLKDITLAAQIDRYNEMLIERKRLLRTSTENNPAIINLDTSIRATKANVQATLEGTLQGLFITCLLYTSGFS